MRNMLKLYLKRGRLTLVFYVDQQSTIAQLKREIVSIVNQTGGLSSLDEEGEDSEDGDIDIPDSAFARKFDDSDDDDSDSDKDNGNDTRNVSKNKIFLSSSENLKIGVVLDKQLKQLIQAKRQKRISKYTFRTMGYSIIGNIPVVVTFVKGTKFVVM